MHITMRCTMYDAYRFSLFASSCLIFLIDECVEKPNWLRPEVGQVFPRGQETRSCHRVAWGSRCPKGPLAGTLMPFVSAYRIHTLAEFTHDLVTSSLSQLQNYNHLEPAHQCHHDRSLRNAFLASIAKTLRRMRRGSLDKP